MRVSVSEKVISWAIERSGLPPGDLEDKFPKIQQWVTGEGKPTLRQLEGLARATLTPFGYFFLSEPPEEKLPVPHYRTIKDDQVRRPSPELLETMRVMQRRQAWMREFMIEEGHEPLPFVNSIESKEDPQVTAQNIYRTLGFSQAWASQQPTWESALRLLRESMESIGILIAVNGILGNNTHRKLNPIEFRGFVLVDEYAPLVFVNGADGKAAQMFTLAHELAHIWFGSSAAFDMRGMQPADEPIEQASNRVAAEFLVPSSRLRDLWPSARQEKEPFQAIARMFKVSVLVAARRALDLQLINRDSFFTFYESYLEDERRGVKRKSEGGDFYANQNLRIGKWFGSTVIRAAREGKLLYHDAYQLTGLFGNTFEGYAESLGYGFAQ
jgi:Zn-dependent peptidase ImmA (M78 family)